MTKQEKKLSEKIKAYHILLLSIMLCPLIMINSNHAVEKRKEAKLYAEASEKFERILIGRKLESFEEGTKKICDSGSDKLKEYYRTGDKSKIGLKDDDDDEDEKTPAHVDALLDILKGAVGEESKNSMEDNAMTYGKHVLGSIVFLVIAFLSLIGWVVCCSCCCCNCYCCCCCTHPKCKLPFFIITMACYALVIAVSIYGLAESNIIFVGISDTECSFLKFFNETIEGESKDYLPKWAGITGINRLLDNLKSKITVIQAGVSTELNNQDNNITHYIDLFEPKLDANSKLVTETGNNIEEMKDPDDQPKKYRLDITSKFRYGIFNNDAANKNAEPQYSYMDLWYKEYSENARQSKQNIGEAKTNFEKIERSGDLTNKLDDVKKQVDDIGNTVDDIKESISGMIIDYSDPINDYGKLGFKIVFSVLAVIDAAIAAFMFLLCFFSGKLCNKCCCCRCAFKLVIHLLWNIFALLMFLTLLIGSLFTIIGSLGKDFVSVINYLVSNKNLKEEKPLIIGEEGKTINVCFNGNGDILTELNVNIDDLEAINKLYDLYNKIDKIERDFQSLRDSHLSVYYTMESDLKKRADYETTDFDVYIDDNSVPPSGSYNLKDLIKKLNQATGENWIFGCDGTNCKDLSGNTDLTNIQSDPTAGPIGDKIISIKKLVENANNDSGTSTFKKLTKELINSYNDFLDSEVIALRVFKGKISEITDVFDEYVGRNGKAFDSVNCLFIGRNLKVILKSLQDSIGSNLNTVGICLILSGCSIAISIVFTIFLIVIINKSVDANKKA